MDGKELAQALHNGERIYGTLIVSPSPYWVDIAVQLGLDCVFIDTEHLPMDWTALGWMCRAYRAVGIAPIVRIAKVDPFEACRVLDAGAVGLVAAYVESAQQVQLLRGAVKLRPIKGKKLEQILSGKAEPDAELAAYLEKFNEGKVLLVNIESVPALEALDEILDVPGLDGVLIGPHDLSCSLGVPEQYDHPLFNEAVQQIIEKARAKGIGVGVHNLPSTQQEIKWAKKGLNLILRLADMTLFRRALHEDLNRLRQGLGEEKGKDQLGEVII